MSEFRTNNVEKVKGQPLAHDPTFVSPSNDDNDAQGFLLAVYCPTTPTDGDVAVYIAANNRFELRAQSDLGGALQPMLIQDESTGEWGFLTDDDGNLLYGYPE